jgi:predicted Ser/Thr protein kinase
MEVLGKGGMGTVYLAEHPDIGRQVAIKVLSRTNSEDILQRFLEEAKAVNRIGHPNIIDIYDFGRTGSGRLYYVMEYLRGRELSAVMTEKRRMTPEEVLPYLEQICAAMQAAHDAGIVHRDLKPANIFVLDAVMPMRVKVLDFGVAKLLDQPKVGFKTMPGMMLGTPLFSAPEQAAAELEKICPQTDLYSIGVIVYWMLSGRPPFLADNNAVLMAMHMTDPAPPIRRRAPNVPQAVAELVEQCLAKKTQDRPRSARDLARDFKAAIGTGMTMPHQPTSRPMPVRGGASALDAEFGPAGAGGPAGSAAEGAAQAQAGVPSPVQIAPPDLPKAGKAPSSGGVMVFVPETPVEEVAIKRADPAASALERPVINPDDFETQVGRVPAAPMQVIDSPEAQRDGAKAIGASFDQPSVARDPAAGARSMAALRDPAVARVPAPMPPASSRDPAPRNPAPRDPTPRDPTPRDPVARDPVRETGPRGPVAARDPACGAALEPLPGLDSESHATVYGKPRAKLPELSKSDSWTNEELEVTEVELVREDLLSVHSMTSEGVDAAEPPTPPAEVIIDEAELKAQLKAATTKPPLSGEEIDPLAITTVGITGSPAPRPSEIPTSEHKAVDAEIPPRGEVPPAAIAAQQLLTGPPSPAIPAPDVSARAAEVLDASIVICTDPEAAGAAAEEADVEIDMLDATHLGPPIKAIPTGPPAPDTDDTD